MMSLENYSLHLLLQQQQQQQQQHSLDWDLHSNINEVEYFHELVPSDWESPMSSEASTGYLQDAVAEWDERCKRRRTAVAAALSPRRDCGSVGMNEELLDLLQNFWDSSNHVDHHPLDGLNCVSQDQENFAGADHDAPNPKLLLLKGHTMQQVSGKRLQEERGGASPINPREKDTNYINIESNSTQPSTLTYLTSRAEGDGQRCRKKKGVGVAYPFAVVKPGGLEGDVTLDDINERILMRPARPVRHPVGEFAPGPCVSACGPGLSGKAVVSLTRIHTRGRGTITIIRTRG